MNKLLIMIALAFLPLQSNAAFVDFNSGIGGFSSTGGESNGRGISFQAISDFSISSFGIFGDLNNESFDVQVYSSIDGSQTNGVLASTTAFSGGTGNGWNDIAINFSFDANSYYVLNWRPTDGVADWSTSLDYFNDATLPVDIAGLATLIDGVAGFDATSFGNTVHARFRINTDLSEIPVPAAVWLFATALLGLFGFSKRRKAT